MAPPPCLSFSPPSTPHPPAGQPLPSAQRPYSTGSPKQWGYTISVGDIPIPISTKCSSISIDSSEYRFGVQMSKSLRGQLETWSGPDFNRDQRNVETEYLFSRCFSF
ncbi:hypothetical protein Fot_15262 [Forsythia ovata]|uniref:Uncharacterized protein n=1 Tax=Forsythia ovata TaxID=205694 RepID=A0ABD1W8M7_9LAMI